MAHYNEDLKLVDRCRQCNRLLPRINHHHFLCSKCYIKRCEEEGNIARLGGVRTDVKETILGDEE